MTSANAEAVELLRDDDHAGILLRAAEQEELAASIHRTAIHDGLIGDDGALLWAEKKAKAFRAVAAALSRPSPAPSEQFAEIAKSPSQQSSAMRDAIDAGLRSFCTDAGDFTMSPAMRRSAADFIMGQSGIFTALALPDREAIARTVEQAVAQHKWAADDGYRRGLEDAAKVANDAAEGSRILHNLAAKDKDRDGCNVHGEGWRVGKQIGAAILALANGDAA